MMTTCFYVMKDSIKSSSRRQKCFAEKGKNVLFYSSKKSRLKLPPPPPRVRDELKKRTGAQV